LNRWNIPPDLEALVLMRDTQCIYCRRPFAGNQGPRGQRKSWEHIVNDETIVNEQNIALCCISCNASKGVKPLSRWLQSRFCLQRAITSESIAEVAQAALVSEQKSPISVSSETS
jgi:hypothetical protein